MKSVAHSHLTINPNNTFLIYNYLPFSPKRTFIIIYMYLLCNNVTNTMAAVQHRLSLLPLLCMLKGGHGTTPLSTCPHPHFTVDCIRGGKDALFNFAFVCFGESLESCETRIKILIKQDKFYLYNDKVKQK